MNTRSLTLQIAVIMMLVALTLTACAASSPGGSAPIPPPSAKMMATAPVSADYMAKEGAAAPMQAAEGAPAAAPEKPASDEKRLVVKNSNLSIVADDAPSFIDATSKMADEMGGFVVSSNLYQSRLDSGEEVPQGSMTIRVPAERFNEAIEKIKSSAKSVQNENTTGEDVTQQYTDLQSRLRNLEETANELRKIKEAAYSTEDVMAVHDRLTQVNEQIEVLKGQIQYFEKAAALSSITIEVTANAAVQPLSIGGWEPVGVARDAVQALIEAVKFIANLAIWLVLFCLPVGLLLLVPAYLIFLLVRKVVRKLPKGKKEKSAATPEAESKEQPK